MTRGENQTSRANQTTANGSEQVRTTIPFSINMGANNSNTKLETIVPSIAKTERNHGGIFKSQHRTCRITFYPKP